MAGGAGDRGAGDRGAGGQGQGGRGAGGSGHALRARDVYIIIHAPNSRG